MSKARTELRQIGSERVAWNVPSTATGAQQTLNVSVAGAKPGDAVVVTPDAPHNSFQYDGYVSANSVVTIRAINNGTTTQDPAATTLTVLAIRP